MTSVAVRVRPSGAPPLCQISPLLFGRGAGNFGPARNHGGKVGGFPAEFTQPLSSVCPEIFLNINFCGHDSFPPVSFFHPPFLPSSFFGLLNLESARPRIDFRLSNRFGNQDLNFHTEGITYKSSPLLLAGTERCQSACQSSRRLMVAVGRGRPFKIC